MVLIVTVKGEYNTLRALELKAGRVKAAGRAAVPRALAFAGTMMVESMKKNIDEAHDPDGVPFDAPARRTPSNRKWQRKTNPARDAGGRFSEMGRMGLLKRTLVMYHSIAYRVLENSMIAGASLNGEAEYFLYHQRGTPHMPKRQFVGFSRDDKRMLTVAVADILGAMKEAL